jgi:hypothetical protein
MQAPSSISVMGFLISFDDIVGGHKQCFRHFEAEAPFNSPAVTGDLPKLAPPVLDVAALGPDQKADHAAGASNRRADPRARRANPISADCLVTFNHL